MPKVVHAQRYAQRPVLSKALVPAAVERKSEYRVTLTAVEKLADLRTLLMAFLSEFDLIVESTVAGVKEESRVRR